MCGGDHTLTAFCPLADSRRRGRKDIFMAFFNSAVDVLQTLVVALGAGLGIWGVINLMEGYGNDNPAQMLMYGKVSQENYVELTAASAIPNKEIKSPSNFALLNEDERK